MKMENGATIKFKNYNRHGKKTKWEGMNVFKCDYLVHGNWVFDEKRNQLAVSGDIAEKIDIVGNQRSSND